MPEISQILHGRHKVSVRRIARIMEAAPSTVGRWIRQPEPATGLNPQRRPVRDNPKIRQLIRDICHEERFQCYGYRRVHAVFCHRSERRISRHSVYKIMREEGLLQAKKRYKPKRPYRLGRMRPEGENQAWQIDMTCFQLSNMRTLYLVVVIDCWSRKIVGWTLDHRSRAGEWIAALRMALDAQGLTSKDQCRQLTLRSDNGSQPCSKSFVEYLAARGVHAEYTGYNAPDDNAFVERVIRTIKEEEIWPNFYDTWSEAHAAVQDYVEFYNHERLHSKLNYLPPVEYAAQQVSLSVA